MSNLYFYIHPYRSFQVTHQEPVHLSKVRFKHRTILSLFMIAVVIGIPTFLRTAGADSIVTRSNVPAMTTVTSSSTSFLVSPVCNHTSLSDPTICYGDSAHPFWDSADMGESIASTVPSGGKQPVPQPPVTGLSVVIAFPNTNGPSTSYVTSGNYLAIGMAAQSQEGSGGLGQDYANFAMVYLTSNGQPMIIGEVWTLPDGQCGSIHICSEAKFDFADGWTCTCYTTTSFTKMITLNMQWNSTTNNLDWRAIVDGVQYTLFSYTPITTTAERYFHVGHLEDQNCNIDGFTPPCYYEYLQFGAMFYAYPNAGWNAYIGSPKYFDQNNHVWRLVQQSTTTLGPDPPDVPSFDYAYWIGGDGFSVTNALDGCSNSGVFPGSSSTLIADQLVIHPGNLVKSQIWGTNCPADIYLPTSAITNGPASGSTQHSAFTLSVTDQDTGKIFAAPGGLAECFYSVESLIGSNWVSTHSTSVRSCGTQSAPSSITITVGSGSDCQSLGTNSCQVNVWSEDHAGNFGPAALMVPSDGDFYTEGQLANFWTCQVNGGGCGAVMASQHMVGTSSVEGIWQSSGGSYIVMMQYPATISSNTLNVTQMGGPGNAPEIFAYVQSSNQPYSVSIEFLTDASDGYVSDVLPEGSATDTGLYVGDTNWHLFQYAVGPNGDSFTSFGSPNWSNINQIDICIGYLQGFTSGNAYVDGLAFLNPTLTPTTQYFTIGGLGGGGGHPLEM